MTLPFERNIFARLADWQGDGLKTGLASLVAIDGSSPRPVGAQIAMAEDGRHCGIISSGCAEEAIIAELAQTIESGDDHITRFGKESPYLDISLPCGSGLDVLFTVSSLGETTGQVVARHASRQPAYVAPNETGALIVGDAPTQTTMYYPPDYRLHVFGSGPQLTTFASIAQLMGHTVLANSTDKNAITTLASQGLQVSPMNHQSRFDPIIFDCFSAVITLFHEHDLELPILTAALDSEAHFIGAMGSRKTHAQRRQHFAVVDTKRPFDDIVGPIGLDIGVQDPSEISLSILAQVTALRPRA